MSMEHANSLSCKIIIDALGQSAHCFVIFFITNITANYCLVIYVRQVL